MKLKKLIVLPLCMALGVIIGTTLDLFRMNLHAHNPQLTTLMVATACVIIVGICILFCIVNLIFANHHEKPCSHR